MIYSKTDVLNLLEQNKLNLSELSGRRISKSQVIIEVGRNSNIDVLTIPNGFEKDLILDLILHFFTLPNYVTRVGKGRKKDFNKSAKTFLQFIEKEKKSFKISTNKLTIKNNELLLPRFIFEIWLKKINNTAPNSAYLLLINTHTILKVSATNKFGKISLWPMEIKQILILLKKIIPRKKAPKKTPPLGIYLGIPNKEFTNKELFMGLRFGVIWLLLQMQNFRCEFYNNKKINKALKDIHGSQSEEIDEFFSGLCRVIYSNSKKLRLILNLK